MTRANLPVLVVSKRLSVMEPTFFEAHVMRRLSPKRHLFERGRLLLRYADL